MNARPERIPIPSAQRWENFRERALPAICLAATLAACGWLWQQQGRVAPFVHGEVGAEIVDIRSPVDGRLEPVEGQPGGQWPLFGKVSAGVTAARIALAVGEDSSLDLSAPIDGVVTKVSGLPGQWVGRGETILQIASSKPTFITCHVPDNGSKPPEPGTMVAVRLRGGGNRWAAAEIEGIGPIVASAIIYDGTSGGATTRGLPVRITLPTDLPLKPGTLVDVRFPPGTPM
ncbi:HlyD family efflux transporter periplasmic adaptor subunit [Lacipirellula sp.]|uniref:HlyD family efflux transporter periplasmic adaptor subunit n=1 Tax=Lacipirellula sp. TaxID=2691419 RepID=UPI003D1128FA